MSSNKIKFTNKVFPSDFNNMSSFELRIILECAFGCIKTASYFGAKVYGEFVHDVIVPLLFDPTTNVKFKNVNLWFTSESALQEFLDYVGGILQKDEDDQYYLTEFGIFITNINIVISEMFPVEDFDVNEVTYSLNDKDEWITTAPNRLVKQIHNKEAVMLCQYWKQIKTENNSSKDYHYSKIKEMFTSKGWSVFLPNAKLMII